MQLDNFKASFDISTPNSKVVVFIVCVFSQYSINLWEKQTGFVVRGMGLYLNRNFVTLFHFKWENLKETQIICKVSSPLYDKKGLNLLCCIIVFTMGSHCFWSLSMYLFTYLILTIPPNIVTNTTSDMKKLRHGEIE